MLVEVLVLFFCFFTFLAGFLAAAVLSLVLAVLLPEVAGCCAANVNGIVATASPTANNVFFMIPFLPGAGFSLPAHTSMLRPAAEIRDSLRRLYGRPNSGGHRLTFISLHY